jgi:NTE family protein
MEKAPMPVPSELLSRLSMHSSTNGLSEAEVGMIAEHVEIVRYQEDEVVQRPDSPVDALYLIYAGKLSVALVFPDKTIKTFAYVGRDEQFGLLALHQDGPAGVKVIAEQPCVLFRIPRDEALRLMRKLPLWNRNLLKAIGGAFRDSVFGGKKLQKKRVIVFIHALQQTRQLTTELVKQLTFLGEKVGVASDHDALCAAGTTYAMSILGTDGNLLPVHEIRTELASWSDADRIVLDCHIKNAASHLYDTIVNCSAAYWVCDSSTIRNVVAELKLLTDKSPRLREKIFTIQLLAEDEQVAPLTPGMKDVCHDTFKLHWNGCHTQSYVCTRAAGMRRILHHLRGISVGLALGGGAARGMAHLGVLQVIEEAGITIDRLSGTSAGALTGIPFSSGESVDCLIERFATDLQPGWFYRMLPYGGSIYALVKYRTGGWNPMLRRYLHDWQLEQLPLPFTAVTVDLVSAEAVWRCRGDATQAILESINLPGIARPICCDGRTLVDGGVLNVVPANVVVKQGANLVISSDVSAKIGFEFYGNTPDTPTKKMKTPSGAAALVRMRTVQDRNIRNLNGGAADIVIEPDVSAVELADFKNARKIAKLGRDAAEKALPELKRILQDMDPQLYRL